MDPRLGYLAVVVVLGTVLLGGFSLVPQADSAASAADPPQPSTPAAQSNLDEFVGETLVFAEAGYRIRIPRFWTMNEQGSNVEMRGFGTSLTIRVGQPDGQLITCEAPDRPWERCRDARIANLDEFRDAVATGPPAGCGWCIPGAKRSVSTMAGEEAVFIRFHGYEYPAQGAESALYVLTIHEDRPYFIRFHTSAERRSPPHLWDEILASFQFVDPSGATPDVRAFREAGFQMTLPAGWSVLAEGASAVRISGPGQAIELAVRVGDADGRLEGACQTQERRWERCEAVTIKTLDDVAEPFQQEEFFAGPVFDTGAECLNPCPTSVRVRPVSLGGEEARQFRIRGHEYAFALHEGRPYLIRYRNGFAFQPSAPRIATIDMLLDTFQFIDEGAVETPSATPPEPSQPTFQTISWEEADIEFDAPASWELRSDTDPLVLSVAGRGGRLTLRIGDGAGRILNCGAATGSPCALVSIPSLEELTDLVAPEQSTFWAPNSTKVSTRTIALGGEMANRLVVEQWPGRQYGGRVRYYVVAFREGRPLIMAWAPTGGGGPIFRRILDSFRFVD